LAEGVAPKELGGGAGEQFEYKGTARGKRPKGEKRGQKKVQNQGGAPVTGLWLGGRKGGGH